MTGQDASQSEARSTRRGRRLDNIFTPLPAGDSQELRMQLFQDGKSTAMLTDYQDDQFRSRGISGGLGGAAQMIREARVRSRGVRWPISMAALIPVR